MTTDVSTTAVTSRREPEAMSVLDTPVDKAQATPSVQEDAAGPNPFAVVGAALLGGVVLAKWIARRGHGRPSR
jgi:hypothetical protein